jgi:hypothetical protein
MYSIYDSVAEVYNKPFCEINDGTAVRAFSQAMQENPNSYDFHLFYIGEYNDSTGLVTPQPPRKVNTVDKQELEEVA